MSPAPVIEDAIPGRGVRAVICQLRTGRGFDARLQTVRTDPAFQGHSPTPLTSTSRCDAFRRSPPRQPLADTADVGEDVRCSRIPIEQDVGTPIAETQTSVSSAVTRAFVHTAFA